MKKIFKLIVSAVLCVMVAGSCLALTGCKVDKFIPEIVDEETGNVSGTLNIRVWEGGFGKKWLTNVAGGFQKKYPNVTIKIEGTVERMVSFAEMLRTGSSQTYDLFFTDMVVYDRAAEENFLGTGGRAFESLKEVYDYKHKGEERTIGEKLIPAVKDTNYVKDDYYMINSYVSAYGFTYNADFISDNEVPNTSSELVELCKSLKKNNITPFVFSGDKGIEYWNQIYSTWFAQYQGLEEYRLMQYGKIKKDDKAVYDVTSTHLPGSLKAMQECEKILWQPNGYIFGQSTGLQYVTAQTKFLDGDAAMMANGSWLLNEMSDLYPDGVNFNFKCMKVPVISAITERCDSIKGEGGKSADSELSALIDAIDANSTALSGEGYSVTLSDYNRVKEARRLNYIGGEAATGIVPTSARNKQLAKLFLKYMYSDEGIELHAKADTGSVLPVVGYDFNEMLSSSDEFRRSSMTILQNSDMFYNNNKDAIFRPYITKTGANIEKQFGSVNAADRMTAQDSFNAVVNKYTANANAAFKAELALHGITL